MEICGGQTHAIVKFGVDELLPPQITLLHGPGCPVCVTPVELIDKATEIASQPGVIFTSFGDMLRVPGTRSDLLACKATGADVRMVYSPLDALKLAQDNPERQVVFFAVGFETTAPANAMVIYEARQRRIKNFSMLVSHVLVPPAVEALLSSPRNRVQGLTGFHPTRSCCSCDRLRASDGDSGLSTTTSLPATAAGSSNATTKASARGSRGETSAGMRNQSRSPAHPRSGESTRADRIAVSRSRVTRKLLMRVMATGHEPRTKELDPEHALVAAPPVCK